MKAAQTSPPDSTSTNAEAEALKKKVDELVAASSVAAELAASEKATLEGKLSDLSADLEAAQSSAIEQANLVSDCFVASK